MAQYSEDTVRHSEDMTQYRNEVMIEVVENGYVDHPAMTSSAGSKNGCDRTCSIVNLSASGFNIP